MEYRLRQLPTLRSPIWDGSSLGFFRSAASEVDASARASAAADSNFMDGDRKSTRLNFSHLRISYGVFCLKKDKQSANREGHLMPLGALIKTVGDQAYT